MTQRPRIYPLLHFADCFLFQMLDSDVDCPNDDLYLEEALQSERAQKLEEDNAEFLKMLAKKAGLNDTIELKDLDQVYDPLFCEVDIIFVFVCSALLKNQYIYC